MNVNIVRYFDPMIYLGNVVHTSSTAGLLKNDGTVDTTSYATSASVSAITDGQSIDSFSDVETALAGKADTSDLPGVATSQEVGLVKPDGTTVTVDANGVLKAVGSGGVAESVIGTDENGTTASKAYAVGEHFIRNDNFCTAIAAIASGATLTLNTNYVEGTIAEALNASNVYSTSEVRIGEWFGQPFYRKCYNITALPSNSELRISHGLTNVSIKRAYGEFGNGTYCASIPYASPSTVYNVGIWTNAGDIFIKTATTEYSSYSGVAILEYTKNS